MKKLFFILVLVVLGLSVAQPLSAQESEQEYVQCILLDNTLSMVGSGGGQNIWADVQEYCYSWVDGLMVPSTVVFFTYAKALSEPQVIKIESDSDKKKVKDAVKNVVINGRHTWIASNLGKAWDYLCENYPTQTKSIYLITDGKEEEIGSSMASVVNKYSAQRGDYDHLYYVDLNGSADSEIFKGDGVSYGQGFCEFAKVSPEFKTIKYVKGVNEIVTQFFDADGKDLSEYYFEAKVTSVSERGVNVHVVPDKVWFKDLEKKGNSYVCDFSLEVYGDAGSEYDVVVDLAGSSDGAKQLVIEPSSFTISVEKRKQAKVDVDGSGWE
jgi:hypothetical protein